jgi:6-pyruvoyltetrahydropterin/6-carboxytetrahydropterin synthase
MFRLTREVRFAVADHDRAAPATAAPNGHSGFPALDGLAHFFIIQVTLGGRPDPESGYVVNIKQIDETVRQRGLPLVQRHVRQRGEPARLTGELFDYLRETWPHLHQMRLRLSPYTSFCVHATEHPMVRFSQRFEFSAAHRLHNPKLDRAANLALFGKCNNPHGHGHNYELEVTLRGRPDESGQLLPVGTLDQIVLSTVINRFDHKFLNLETPEFAELNPTVENIAKTIFSLLKPPLSQAKAELAAVTVWETPKTWCEYWE